MKTLQKVVFILFVFLFIFAFTLPSHASNLNTLSTISTKSIALDADDVISFPSFATNGEVKVKVDETKAGSGYSLYYQFIPLSDTTFNAIENAINQQKDAYQKMQDDLKSKKESLTTEKTKVEEAYAEYKKQYELDPDSTETTNAQKAYQTLMDTYNAHVKDYNDLAVTYQSQLDTLTNKVYDMYTQYSDTNWVKSENNLAKYKGLETGTLHFLLWVKLVKADNTPIYDCQIYTFTIPKEDTPQDTNTDKENTTPKKDTTTPSATDSTTAKKQLPKTGTNLTILGILIVISFVGYFSYKKYHTIDR